ncbi:uncharacterized protein [Rutidosis leptorrhynchoides]|uniref:uncharacterized protein n=1 Tax=Rutidosis leptorrhynchoides TaxID=125765 RepID=UPI003A98F769
MDSFVEPVVFRIPFGFIQEATKNFTNIIGRGGYGGVYKGELTLSGKLTTVAVKRLDSNLTRQRHKEFSMEVQVLARLKHPNLVSLVGFCEEDPERILVYEYANRGSLDKYLNTVDHSGSSLTWKQRLNICIDAARGLDYLHNHAEEQYRVIHGDIKSSNILIDDNGKAMITDFGLSKFANTTDDICLISTNVCGTLGYCDPKYIQTGLLTKESDVYSFGVVLFEVLCGKDRYLPQLVMRYYREGKLNQIIDLNLSIYINTDSMKRFSRIAYQCLLDDPEARPTMDTVLQELETALQPLESLRLRLINIDHLQIGLQVIVSATRNFSDENLIQKDELGMYYKGKMFLSGKLTDIIARRVGYTYEQNAGFWTEIYMLDSLKHKNIVSIAGFCDENGEKIIIYERTVHGHLDRHLTDATKLTWIQRLKICLGVAQALDYVHYDVIHCDINSSKILLDENWEPKIFGFEHSTKFPGGWRHRLLSSHHFDTSNYRDPTCIDATTVTPRYDVYSFGVMLFEVLCGRKSFLIKDGGVHQSLLELAKRCLADEKLDEIIDKGLRDQMELQSLKIFSEIAYRCLEEQMRRPTMDQVVKKLEEAIEHQWKQENMVLREHQTNADEATPSAILKRGNLDRMTIQLADIITATNNFDKDYCIGSGGYGMVYKADLEHHDVQSLSSKEENKKDARPKRRRTVAIKRIMNRQDDQGEQGFFAELELLTSCNHCNIVSLLGFSLQNKEMILVYEYLTNGSLDDYLASAERKVNLNWCHRLQICLDIAKGLEYLHTNKEGKPRIIHRDIKSANILLDESWNAKIADFGLSKFHPANQLASTILTKHAVGTEVYLDPEYMSTGRYKKESDVYSFGVVLFELRSGRLAYDSHFIEENVKGLAPIARRRFNEKTLKELIDPKMIEEDDDHTFTLNRGPNQDSFDAFSKVAYQCLAETQAKRPTMETVIKELHKALNFQGETMVLLRFQHGDIVRATENFAEKYRVGLATYNTVYKAELLDHFESKNSSSIEEKNNTGEELSKRITVALKVISGRKHGQEKQDFLAEIELRTRYKHPNVASLVGFCDKGPEMILVYEHGSDGSLNGYLRSDHNIRSKLTWKLRLQICLEIARGLNYLHTKMDSKHKIIHGDIKSENILLFKKSEAKLEAKIAYYGLFKLHPDNQDSSTPLTNDTKVYWDPRYQRTGKLQIESDIYAFGVVLFEIFCGRCAYDPDYMVENDKGLAPIACRRYSEGTIKEMMDPILSQEETDVFSTNTGPNQDSLDAFLDIACECLGETQAKRPNMETVIKELEKALDFQENLMNKLQISLEDIEFATRNFNQEGCVRKGKDWKAYKGQLPHANICTSIVAKRWNSKSGEGDRQFRTELDILLKCQHENIIGLVGYCNNMNETIIVYPDVPNCSLDMYLSDASFNWMKRLDICIAIATGLEFFHKHDMTLNKVALRDIKSSSILLNVVDWKAASKMKTKIKDNWKAKISVQEMFLLDSIQLDMEHVSTDGYCYIDPEYAKRGLLTEKSVIYSFGVILFEILCGRLAWVEGYVNHSEPLVPLAKRKYVEGKIDEIVFEGLKKQIVPTSLTTFADIAYRCLCDDGDERPEASEVVKQLKKALEFQEDDEIWEPQLPGNYKEIIGMSDSPEMYSSERKKDLYKVLSEGIFIQNQKVWLSLSSTGRVNTLISATMFSYGDRRSHKCRSIEKSFTRFPKVAKMMDISNLKIQIKIDTNVLSSDVTYGVRLVFKFCDPIIVSRKLTYVNLKYRMGDKTLHSYFATQRDDDSGWMMIELCHFLKQKQEDTVFEVLLESFSGCYCESRSIYVQGIEFKAIDKVNKKESEKLKGGNVTKCLIVSAKEFLYNPPRMKSFQFEPSDKSRFEDVVDLPREQVFRIKYKIEIKKLSPFTEYACYLVFKLSDKCRGLFSPVKVRNILHKKNKPIKFIYFRSPAPYNQYDCANWVPEPRKDGWMEVMVWKFNSNYNKSGKNIIPMHLQLVAYEGTMSGLIVRGLEFRPM